VRDLLEQHAADIARQIRKVGVRIIDYSLQARQIANAFWGDVTELVEMRPERVHGFGALLHELLACPERNGARLLIS
jgi:hypothetical protein